MLGACAVQGNSTGHTLLLVSFLGLAATGLPLKYSQSGWAKVLASSLGGFEWTGLWHRVFALSTLGCFAAYMVLLASRYGSGRRRGESRAGLVLGPDSPVPNGRDLA